MILNSSRMPDSIAWNMARNNYKPLHCPKCNQHYKYQEKLEIHMKEKHPDNDVSCILTTLSSLLPLSTSVSASATSTSSPLTSLASLASSIGVPISGAPPTLTSGTNGNGQGVDLSQQAAAMANVSVSTYLNYVQVILYQINLLFCHQLTHHMTTVFFRFTQIVLKFRKQVSRCILG